MPTVPTSTSRRAVRKEIWAAGIALGSFALVMLTLLPGPFSRGMDDTDDLFYRIYYKLRPIEPHAARDVVIVTADDPSMRMVNKVYGDNWPWRRSLWGVMAKYAARAGAKVIAFDVLFEEGSTFNHTMPDDQDFAKLIEAARDTHGRPVPVVFACQTAGDGSYPPFGPPIRNPIFGVANIEKTEYFRTYEPTVRGKDSLATAAVIAAGEVPKLTSLFNIHYFGPGHADDKVKPLITFVPAGDVLNAALKRHATTNTSDFSPAIFKDKIVLFGATGSGTYDVKASPISKVYPGVEMHATAVENILTGEKVEEFPLLVLIAFPLLFAVWAAFGVIVPRSASYKLLAPALAIVLLLGVGVLLFRSPHIRWLPPAHSLLVLLLATPSAFAYTYFVQDKQSRFMLRALKKVVSPTVADELSQNPQRLERNTRPRMLTVLFSDLANFTSLSESMKEDNQKLVALLDEYLEAMSKEVIAQDGTLDKYIGDSIMCFWNAPIEQKDHAIRACKAALAMEGLKKEYTIPSQEPGKPDQHVYTRFGINTSVANYGFVGSSNLMNYTVLGDGVNLASRLEGANKLYGTRILISENTARMVESQFHLRRIDRLRVKGKNQSIDVFELLADRTDSNNALSKRMLAVTEKYHAAFDEYQKQNWTEARRILLESCEAFGEDNPSTTLLGRVNAYAEHPPGANWDGAYGAVDK